MRPGARRVVVALAVVAVVAVGVGLGAPVAQAHGGAAQILVRDQIPVGDLGLDFRVEIVYVLDGHPAAPATFDVAAVSADGGVVESIELTPTLEEGIYEASVEFPSGGAWDVTFTASLPPSELTESVVVGDTAPPAAEPGDGDGDGEVDEASVVSSEGSGVPTALVVGVVVAGLIVAVVGAFIIRGVSRKRRDPAATRTSADSST